MRDTHSFTIILITTQKTSHTTYTHSYSHNAQAPYIHVIVTTMPIPPIPDAESDSGARGTPENYG